MPLLIVTIRRNSDDSRAMTSAATVLYSNAFWSWSRPVRTLVLALDLLGRTFSVVSRSFSCRSVVLSLWSRSISPIAETTLETPDATPSTAPWIGRSA